MRSSPNDDGFISGIYNYCDRWCERCDFTHRCRVFADDVVPKSGSIPR